MPSDKKKGTKTSSFGSPGRENHDSSAFYSSRLYQGTESMDHTPYHQNPIPEDVINKIHHQSSESMSQLPDSSVHLMVTSPPYNVQKEYDDDLTLEEYLSLLRNVLGETFRVLVPGGRACINIANLGRKPYIPLHTMVIAEMLAMGYLMRGEIIWDKAASASASTAWGSWLSAANPVLRDVHEYILIFSKQNFAREGKREHSTITKPEFLEWTKSIWTFPTVSAKKIGHPAPFPEELPRRLIQLYSFEGDVVLDPFCGAGTTCVVAKKTGRQFVGYEIHEEYIHLAESRLGEIQPYPDPPQESET